MSDSDVSPGPPRTGIRPGTAASIPLLAVRLGTVLLLSLLIGAGLLPIWTVRYVPIYDYQNHLLEAQVVARYADPALAYARDYTIREGWHLRSNALTGIMMVGLGQALPMDLAGKVVLSLYVALLVCGMAALLGHLGQPAWLLLSAPALLYNLTFTAGMLNWSYGLALLPFALLAYLRWQRGSRWAAAALAGLALLIYIAHVLAWGLCLLMLCALAAADNLRPRRFLALIAVLSSAVPLLLVTRPLFAAAPPLIGLALWGGGALVRHLKLRPLAVVALGGGVGLACLAAFKVLKPRLSDLLRDIDYSLNARLVAPLRLFTLPQHQLPIQWDLVGANMAILGLTVALAALLALSSITPARDGARPSGGWLAVLGALAFAYLVIPTRTPDIVVTEPRVLLAACVAGLAAVRLPPPGSRRRLALVGLHIALALTATAATTGYAWRYDATAQHWAGQLAQIPPARRVLVFSNPLDVPRGGWGSLARISQIFDGNQFSSTYALERGGFVANTFFNGPLLPRSPHLIPPYWWPAFEPAAYVSGHCRQLRAAYDYTVVWNLGDSPLRAALQGCLGAPLRAEEPLTTWDHRLATEH